MKNDRKLVLDTNVLISRLLFPSGIAAKAVDHALEWGLPLIKEAKHFLMSFKK